LIIILISYWVAEAKGTGASGIKMYAYLSNNEVVKLLKKLKDKI
jgi:hypothetical protein